MWIVRQVICRFVQFIGLIAVLNGLASIKPLHATITDFVDGKQAFDAGALATKILPVTAPTLIGLLIIYGIQLALAFWSDLDKRVAAHPNEPWMWRKEWAEQHIKPNLRAAVIGLAIAWLFYLVIAVPVAVMLGSQKNPGVVYSFLGVLGLFLFAFTRMAWMGRTWARAELKLADNPGVLGGPISGVVILKESFPAETVFRVELTCEKTTQGSGEDSHSTTSVIWQTQKLLDRTMDSLEPNTTALPFHFAIPMACTPTSEETVSWKRMMASTKSARINYRWYVLVSRRDDELKASAKFEVPVFETANSSDDYREDESLVADFTYKPKPDEVLKKIGFAEETLPNGKRLRFYLYRGDIFWALVVMLFVIVIGLTANFLWVRPWPVPFFIAFIPGALGLMMIYGIFEMLCWQATLTIEQDEIEIETGYIGFRRKFGYSRKSPPYTRTHKEFEPQNGPPMFSVQFEGPDSKQYNLVRKIDGDQDAKAVRDWVKKQWQN
jgi:hypothetical protein